MLQSQINSFSRMVRTCGLVDFGFTGPNYTWSNMQKCIEYVQERLDRVLGDALCVEKLMSYRVVHLPRS